MPDSDEIKRQMAQIQKELQKTEEALARLKKKIAGSEEGAKDEPSGKTGKKKG